MLNSIHSQINVAKCHTWMQIWWISNDDGIGCSKFAFSSILLYVRSLKVKSCHDLHVVHTLDIWIPCQMPQTMVWWILDHWTPWHYRHPRKTRTSRKCCVHGWVICRWKLNLLAYKRTTAQLEVQSSYFVGTRYLCQISHGGTEQHWDLFSNIFEYKVSITWTRSFKHCSRNVMATIWIRAFERHFNENDCIEGRFQHTGGKWLIHSTKRRKDNQLQSLEHPCRIS